MLGVLYMSTSFANTGPPAVASFGWREQPIVIPPIFDEATLVLHVPSFGLRIRTAITHIEHDAEFSHMVVNAFIEDGVTATLTFDGRLIKGGGFQVGSAYLEVQVSEPRARAHFIAQRFMTVIGLAGKVDVAIPEVDLSVNLDMHSSLPEISKQMQRCQITYALMVIERAAGLEFTLPAQMKKGDYSAITFAYQAIVERDFLWRSDTIKVTLAMRKADLEQPLPMIPPSLTLGPQPGSRTVFGQDVALGSEIMIIEDGVAESVEQTATAESSEQVVAEVTIRSPSGMVRSQFTEAPRLPADPWDEKVQAFIDLEAQLDDRLAEAYNALAARSLAGLSGEQARAVTERPALDEDAYLIGS